jgi:hypothetical protein
MFKVHYRDGGSWLGLLPAKYLLRKLVAPLISARRRRKYSLDK